MAGEGKVTEEIKTISVAEFRRLGYLQELNRCFLHPLGLALSVAVEPDSDEETFGVIWDYRDDPEGLMFGNMEKPENIERANRIAEEFTAKAEARTAKLGANIQPVPSTVK